MKKYKIHFVCRGNIYRSRLAEAWVAAINNTRVIANSSGINSDEDNPGIDISPYAESATRNLSMADKFSKHKIQTSDSLLATADIIVFLSKDVYRDAAKVYAFNAFKSVVWDVEDIDIRAKRKRVSPHDKKRWDLIASQTCSYIQRKVEALVQDITRVSWTSIVNETNEPLGFRLPISWANDQSLWHRGCHAVITTSDKKFVIEKRSKIIVFSPGKLDVGVGGSVDDGETPEQAIVREVKEELGLTIHRDWIKSIDTRKRDSYHPHYHKHTKVFMYTYHVKLPMESPAIHMQTSEVAKVALIGHKRLSMLLKTHYLRGLGSLNPGTRYYQQVVKLALENL